jgi:hypothetical protein
MTATNASAHTVFQTIARMRVNDGSLFMATSARDSNR